MHCSIAFLLYQMHNQSGLPEKGRLKHNQVSKSQVSEKSTLEFTFITIYNKMKFKKSMIWHACSFLAIFMSESIISAFWHKDGGTK